MLDLLNYLVDSVIFFFNFTYQFLTSGIYDLFVWLFSKLIQHITLGFIEFALFAIPFAWDTAKAIISDIGISAHLASAWASLDSETLGLATMFRIPDCVNIIVSAFMTRFVLRFIPFV